MAGGKHGRFLGWPRALQAPYVRDRCGAGPTRGHSSASKPPRKITHQALRQPWGRLPKLRGSGTATFFRAASPPGPCREIVVTIAAVCGSGVGPSDVAY